MAQLIRCKSCGLVIEENRVKDVCPACGVARKMFEAFNDPISRNRRRVLQLDIHPIIVHFAVAFTVSALVTALYILAFPVLFHRTATGAMRAFGGTLPLIVAAAWLSGRYDGSVRFRKAKSLYLRTKTFVGIAFFICSAAAAALIFAIGPFIAWVSVVNVVLFAVCVGLAFVQGRLGTRMLCCLFPG
jgi:uncharacterized membrane protein